MSIDRNDFNLVDEGDLQELITAQVSEGLHIEYKQTCYGSTRSQNKELAKDVCAFANAYGGHLILGIQESGGVATDIVGFNIDADAEILRMEQIIRSSIEPRISGIRIRAITLTNGNYVFLLRIPKSWHPPHRVSAQGSNKFHVRNSAGVHEPSIEELRMMFNLSSTNLEKALELRNNRIEAINSGENIRPLVNDGRLFLHIVPTATFSGMVNINVKTIFDYSQYFYPLGTTSRTPKYNLHGFVNERGGTQNLGYTQIFRTGVLEATKASILRGGNIRHIPGVSFESWIFSRLADYVNGLQVINVPPPLVIMISLTGIGGAQYIVENTTWHEDFPPLPSNIFLPPSIIEDYGEIVEYHRSVRPAFDALWNAAGYSRNNFFNDDGLWVGPG